MQSDGVLVLVGILANLLCPLRIKDTHDSSTVLLNIF